MEYSNRIGRAYGFFDAGASIDELRDWLPAIRRLIRIPQEVGFSLTDDVGSVEGDGVLRYVGRDAKQAGYRYALVTSYPGATNRVAADETAPVLNQIYVNTDGKGFVGEIVFEENGRRVLRE